MNQERDDEISDAKHGSFDRRQFLASIAAIGAVPLLMNVSGATAVAQDVVAPVNSTKSIIGGYGSWAAGLSNEPGLMPLRNGGRKDLDAWRAEGRAKTMECIAPPDIGVNPKVTVKRKFEFDGLLVEEHSWQLPCSRPNVSGLRAAAWRFRPEADTRTAGGVSHRMLVIPKRKPGGRHILGAVGGCVALWA